MQEIVNVGLSGESVCIGASEAGEHGNWSREKCRAKKMRMEQEEGQTLHNKTNEMDAKILHGFWMCRKTNEP